MERIIIPEQGSIVVRNDPQGVRPVLEAALRNFAKAPADQRWCRECRSAMATADGASTGNDRVCWSVNTTAADVHIDHGLAGKLVLEYEQYSGLGPEAEEVLKRPVMLRG